MEMITEAERELVGMLGKCAGKFANEVCGRGPTRDHDISEFIGHIHDLQAAVLQNVAARALPGEIRAKGESLRGT